MSSAAEPPRRRRGATLEQAIFAAVLEELSEVGYSSASLDGIARRAGIGRMSLYRRWPGKPELVLDAMRASMPPQPDRDTAMPMREQVIALLRAMFVAPHGLPVLILHLTAAQTAELRETDIGRAMRTEVLAPRIRVLQDAFDDALTRGELRRGANPELLGLTGVAVLFQRILLTGQQPTMDDVIGVVDDILIPAAVGKAP